jgi:hypothetical protein
MVRITCLLIVFTLSNLNGQSVSKLIGAKPAGLGYATATLQNEWAIFNNIAGLATIEESYFAATYEVRPSLTAGNRFGALASMPFSFGKIGLGAFRFGDDIYSEQLVSLGFANQIGNTSVGARISYIQYNAEGFGTHGTVGFDFGGITRITRQLYIGAWIQNLNQPKLRFNNEEKVPVKLYAALGFSPSEKFTVVTELEKDILYPVIWKSGMEYTIHKKFFVRAGFNLNPNAFFAGLGFQSWRIKIDYALQSFTQFNATHQASASYRIYKINKSKE